MNWKLVVLLLILFSFIMGSYAVDWNNANVRGLYLNSVDVNDFSPLELIRGNITDVFVISSRFTNPKYDVNLPKVISKLNGTGIRIHAWIICFQDVDGTFVNPENNTTYPNQLIEDIGKIVSDYDIDGVQLDYVRYPIENPAYLYDGDKNVTQFVSNVSDKIKAIKPNVALSAALVPEWFDNDDYSLVNALNRQTPPNISKGENTTLIFGQNYVEMSQYLDFLMPMIYRGYSFRDTYWVETTTRFAVERVGKPVIPAIQTYRSDDDLTRLSMKELDGDIQATFNGGSKGFALFRYGVLDKSFFNSFTTNNDKSVSDDGINSAINDVNPNYFSLYKTGFPLFLVLILSVFGILSWRRK
ncbi:MAG: hypothetical protein LBT10_08080 [Methanobrevibacter sp.]|jgi:hypothetical protein|nr:hypothetical protein [Methanobrevibacter sp.]